MANELILKNLEARVKELVQGFEGKTAKIGWMESARYEDGTPVAYVATIQEYGAPSVGIPPRPFIEPTVQDKQAEWIDDLGRGAVAVMRGRMGADDVLEQVGAKVAGEIRQAIENVTSPALSPVTLLLRKWRREGQMITGATVAEARRQVASGDYDTGGVNSDPLTDSGTMIATIRNWT